MPRISVSDMPARPYKSLPDASTDQLSQEPASSRSANFEQQSANEVSAFHTNLLGFQNTLAELGADKGLANYNRDDEIETLMKDAINANKYLLNDIDRMVYDIPGLGPTLGPSKFNDCQCAFYSDDPSQLSMRSNASSMKFSTRWRTLPTPSSTPSSHSSRIS